MFMDEESSGNEGSHSLITGFADQQVGNRKTAIMELEKAADLTDNKGQKLELLGMAAEIHCIIHIEDGIKAYNNILRIDPNYVPAHFVLADCYAETYSHHKESPPTSYNYEHFKGNDKLALIEYKWVKEHAPNLASELESKLTGCGINI